MNDLGFRLCEPSPLMHIPKRNFIFIFIGVFIICLGLLNSRFLYISARYYLDKTDFVRAEPSIKFLPIAEAIERRPLPESATLVIDSIGITAPIIFEKSEVPSIIYKDLEKGVVSYAGTPKPGVNGVAVLLGHSSAFPWYRGKYGSVFALLNKLQPEEKIHVQYSDGRTFTFAVKQSLVFNPLSEDERLKLIEQKEKPTLVLVSCWPVGTAYKRIAVVAELVD